MRAAGGQPWAGKESTPVLGLLETAVATEIVVLVVWPSQSAEDEGDAWWWRWRMAVHVYEGEK